MLDKRYVSKDIIDETDKLVKSLGPTEQKELKHLEDDGYEAKAVQIVQFVDVQGNVRKAADVESDKRRWFSMPHKTVAYALGIFDGMELINKKEIHDIILAEYGPDTFSIH